MIAIDYVERIRKAYKEEDYHEIERLEREYGDQEVTLKELEEVVSFDTEALLAYTLETDAKYNDIIERLLTLLQENGVIKEEDIDLLLDLDEGDEEEYE